MADVQTPQINEETPVSVETPVVEEAVEATAVETAPAEETKETKAESKKAPAKKSASSSAPLTMADLLAQSDQALKIPQSGDIVTGTVVSINRKMVVVDIGGKTEGLVVDREFQQAEDFIVDLKPGDKVDVYILENQGDRGQIYLSLKKAAMDKKWDEIIAIQQKEEPVSVRAIETNRGGLVVVFEGIRGFIPTSQFGRELSGRLDSLRGKDVTAKILEVDKEKNRLIFSERLVSEASELANADAALATVKEGDEVEGIITGIKPFGIFVAVEVPLQDKEQMGVLEGLVHISEVSWDKIDDLTLMYKKGQRIRAQVVAVNTEHGKLTLSIKQLQDDPWDDFVQTYPEGTTIAGTVSKVVPFGVFVTIAPGIEGLIHESKLGGVPYGAGDKATVVIDSIDTEQRRVRLSPAATDVPVTYK
jgi:small subunit ribosomal protein S1